MSELLDEIVRKYEPAMRERGDHDLLEAIERHRSEPVDVEVLQTAIEAVYYTPRDQSLARAIAAKYVALVASESEPQ